MKTVIKVGFILSALFVTLAHAADNKFSAVKRIVEREFPNIQMSDMKPSAMPGLLEFSVGAQVMYVSEDGKFLFQGDLYRTNPELNLTGESEKVNRVAELNKLGEDNMIIFEPKNGRKSYITVFTDVDCFYCRKLHEEIDQFMDLGIAVRYVFLPFRGPKSMQKAIDVWCSKDRQKALTYAKLGGQNSQVKCDTPISQHIQIGTNFNVRGTPAIVLPDGTMAPGYRPAKMVAVMLGVAKVVK